MEKTENRTVKRTEKQAAKPQKSIRDIQRQHFSLRRLGAAALALLIIFTLLHYLGGGSGATTVQAQSIARMLAEEDVPIRSIRATRDGYEITYAAEDAVGRFDDAILSDWGMIYGTAAAHDCDTVSIITTLDGQPLHKQTVACDAIRAFVRGVLTEEEFWLLVEHKSLK